MGIPINFDYFAQIHKHRVKKHNTISDLVDVGCYPGCHKCQHFTVHSRQRRAGDEAWVLSGVS